MTHQAKATQLSLLLHVLMVFGVMLSSRNKAPETPPLLIDFSIVASKATAGDPAGDIDSKQQLAPASPSPEPTPTPVEKTVESQNPLATARKISEKTVSQDKLAREKAKRFVPPNSEKREKPLSRFDDSGQRGESHPAVNSGEEPASDANREDAGGAATTGGQQTGKSPETGEAMGNSDKAGGRSDDFEYVRNLIIANLSFPAAAKRRGLTGRIVVAFFLKGDGQVVDLTVIDSSGHQILDDNVVATIRRIAPFPRPSAPARLILPIIFNWR
jgi:periplasmic protein TonB